MLQASIPAVARCIEAMRNDPLLNAFPFDKVTFAEIVLRVIRQGTPLERAAMAKHLTPEACFFFPSTSQTIKGSVNVQDVIDNVFKPMFGLLCDHFGVNFFGNMDTVAYSLMTEFGGLSYADFMLCFERVKNGRYVRETQHIMTRGINAEFMSAWLKQYAEEREHCRDAAYKQYSPENTPITGGDPVTGERIAEYNRAKIGAKQRRDDLQHIADTAFDEWENDLYTSGVYRQGFKTIFVERDDLDENGDKQYNSDGTVKKKSVRQEVLCASDDPNVSRFDDYAIRVPKPGALERKVKRIIYEFICDGDRQAMETYFAEFIERVRNKYADEENPSAFIESELKIILSAFTTVKRNLPGAKMIEQMYRAAYPDATQGEIAASVRRDLDDIDVQYFDDYLPHCIQKKYPRLDRDEFVIVVSMAGYLNQGFPNVFKGLFE